MMDEQNLAARLDATPLYEGCGDESDLPERAAAELRRQHAEIERLSAALARARPYITGAYECAFPDESENRDVLADVDAALMPNF